MVFMTNVSPETSAFEYVSNQFASCWEIKICMKFTHIS